MLVGCGGVYHDGGLARVMEFDQLMIPEHSRFSIGQSHSCSWKRQGDVLIPVLLRGGAEKPVRVLSVERIRNA